MSISIIKLGKLTIILSKQYVSFVTRQRFKYSSWLNSSLQFLCILKYGIYVSTEYNVWLLKNIGVLKAILI